MRPYEAAQDHGLADFISALCPQYSLPSLTTLRPMTPELMIHVENLVCCKPTQLMFLEMKRHLTSLQDRIFWLSCDGWSSVSWVLCVQQESDHTSEHLAEETTETLKAWDVSLSTDIQGLVADNTNSMPALASLLGVRFRGCAAHKHRVFSQ